MVSEYVNEWDGFFRLKNREETQSFALNWESDTMHIHIAPQVSNRFLFII